MKYNINELLFCRLYEKNQKGRKVIDIRKFGDAGNYYKFGSKETGSKFVWTPEWMLYKQDEFIVEVKSGKLLSMELTHEI